MKKLILLIGTISLLLNACVSKTLLRTEDGPIIESRKNLTQTHSPIEYETSFEIVEENNHSYLKVKVLRNESLVEKWEDVYSKVDVYGTKCKLWYGSHSFLHDNKRDENEYCTFDIGSFAITHLLLYGLLLDAFVPFTSFEDKVIETKVYALDSSISTKTEYNTIKNINPIQAKSIKLNINNITASADNLDNSSKFDFKSFKIKPEALNTPTKVSIDFDNEHLDVTREFTSFVDTENKRLADVKETKRVQKLNDLCATGSWKACNENPEKTISKYDLVSYLIPYGGKLKKGTIYPGRAFIPLQKVTDGYLLTPHSQYWRSEAIGAEPIFLQTNKNLPREQYFCAWLLYTGDHEYVAIDGFERKIPSFRLYDGAVENDNCPRLKEGY